MAAYEHAWTRTRCAYPIGVHRRPKCRQPHTGRSPHCNSRKERGRYLLEQWVTPESTAVDASHDTIRSVYRRARPHGPTHSPLDRPDNRRMQNAESPDSASRRPHGPGRPPALTIIEGSGAGKNTAAQGGGSDSPFRMIRDGDRVAVALSGGKDSATMLEALLLLQKRAPIDFSVCAFTVEQGKFLQPHRAARRISETARRRLDVFPRCGIPAPAGRTARPRLRHVQPLPAARGVRNRARLGRQRDRLRPHRRRFLRSAAPQRHVHRTTERPAGRHRIRASATTV